MCLDNPLRPNCCPSSTEAQVVHATRFGKQRAGFRVNYVILGIVSAGLQRQGSMYKRHTKRRRILTRDAERPERSCLALRGGLRSRCAASAPRGGGGGGGAFFPTAGRLLGELNGTASSSEAAEMHSRQFSSLSHESAPA